jgi:hypothetical protein
VLHKLAEELELPKLTFQVIRRNSWQDEGSFQGYPVHDAALEGVDDNGCIYTVAGKGSTYGD